MTAPALIGIDLGTTNSVISVYQKTGESGYKPLDPKYPSFPVKDGIVTVLPNPEGSATTPSVVSYDGKRLLVGPKAKQLRTLGDSNTVGSFKVDMGSLKTYELGGRTWTPVELSAQVLKYMKEYAEAAIGQPVTEAVITVPAYFTELQRKATREAGEMAGLIVKRIINEPTAAALAYGIDMDEEKTVMVYDLGGGTFDVSALSVEPDVIEVISTRGDNHLGGDNLDHELANTITKFLRKVLKDYRPGNVAAVKVLQEIARDMKEQLSSRTEVENDLSALMRVDATFKGLEEPLLITRSLFEKVIAPFIERTIHILRETLKDVNMDVHEIDSVLLVGGSTRIPIIKTLIEHLVPVLKGKVLANVVDPDLSISVGAAIQAAIAAGENTSTVLIDVTPMDLSVEIEGGYLSTVVKSNSPLPVKKSKILTTSHDNQTVVVFKVYQGNKPLAAENEYLGEFSLTGVKSAKAGIPQLEVTYSININGELEVTAVDLGTMRKASITRKLR